MQQGRVVSASQLAPLYDKPKLKHFLCTKCHRVINSKFLKYSTKDEKVCCNCGEHYIPASIKDALNGL